MASIFPWRGKKAAENEKDDDFGVDSTAIRMRPSLNTTAEERLKTLPLSEQSLAERYLTKPNVLSRDKLELDLLRRNITNAMNDKHYSVEHFMVMASCNTFHNAMALRTHRLAITETFPVAMANAATLDDWRILRLSKMQKQMRLVREACDVILDTAGRGVSWSVSAGKENKKDDSSGETDIVLADNETNDNLAENADNVIIAKIMRCASTRAMLKKLGRESIAYGIWHGTTKYTYKHKWVDEESYGGKMPEVLAADIDLTKVPEGDKVQVYFALWYCFVHFYADISKLTTLTKGGGYRKSKMECEAMVRLLQKHGIDLQWHVNDENESGGDLYGDDDNTETLYDPDDGGLGDIVHGGGICEAGVSGCPRIFAAAQKYLSSGEVDQLDPDKKPTGIGSTYEDNFVKAHLELVGRRLHRLLYSRSNTMLQQINDEISAIEGVQEAHTTAKVKLLAALTALLISLGNFVGGYLLALATGGIEE
jgi:hypothetical protein